MDTEYKIIGGDGREYGPVGLDELQAWVRDGRVAGTTSVWKSESATWANASTYPELAFELGTLPPSLPTTGSAVNVPAQEAAPVGFWARLAAWIVDYFAFGLIFGMIWLVLSFIMGWAPIVLPEPDADPTAYLQKIAEFFDKNIGLLMGHLLIRKIFEAGYFTFFNGKWGASPGKMVLGARIVLLDGAPIGYKIALLRWFGTQVSGVIFGIGYLFIAFREDKRALHDLMVGTKVVYKR